MFNWFKKKDPQPSTEEKVIVKSPEEVQKILDSIRADFEKLKEENDDESKAKLFEMIGLKYADAEKVDDAISNLEKSLELKLSMGDGYKKLMALYNSKRAEAARERDNDKIDYYMSKMDDMRNIAKKVTLSR